MDDPRYRTQRWRKLARRVVRRDGYRCAVPDCTNDMRRPRMACADHIIEPENGGDFWDPANLRALCRPHNLAKGLDSAARTADRSSPNG